MFDRCEALLAEGFKADTATFNTLLKACQRAKDSERARATYALMQKRGIEPDSITFCTLVKVPLPALSFRGKRNLRAPMLH